MEKILIFGDGQIGNFYKVYFDQQKMQSIISPADVTKIDEIKRAIDFYKPTVVINTAAMTSLEWCETNKLEAFNINVLGADNVAKICDENKIYFIHFSSGCIFSSKDENDAKKEDSLPDPISYYAFTKVWSEEMIKYNKSSEFKYLILRPRQPVSAQVNHKNMLLKLLTFTRFIDVPNAGTVIEDLMEWTKGLIEKRVTGTLNVANEGWTTPYEIGLMLKEYVLHDLPVAKITKEELNKLTPVRRIDTILDISRLKSLNFDVKSYKERLKEIIIELGKNIKHGEKEQTKKELELTVSHSKQRTLVNDSWKKLLD